MKKLFMIIPLAVLLCLLFGCQKQVKEGITMGLDALKEYYSHTHKAFPDLHATLDETIVKDDKIIWVWTFTGTNTGMFHTPLGDIPATGKKVQFSGVAIDRLTEGKIVEEWVYFNVLNVLMQLGFTVIPPQPSPPEEVK